MSGEELLTFVCDTCSATTVRSSDDFAVVSKLECCENPKYVLEVLGNDGKKHLIEYGQYSSLERNGKTSKNKKGETMLNIYVEEPKDTLPINPPPKKEPVVVKEEISTDEKTIETLKQAFTEIKNILRTFMDMKEEYYTLVALWVLGTYVYEAFECYPLLFVNATKGSGKTRLMKLLEQMVWNGKLQLNVSESVLFRTKKKHTVLLDELEEITSKEQGTIREMMNASYKRGNRVQRMRRVQTKEGEDWKVEEFDLYSPMGMANIHGMDETVLDRCITVMLEKSTDVSRTKFLENYTNYTPLKHLKTSLTSLECSLCSLCTKKNNITKWNDFILSLPPSPTHTATLTTYTTLTTLTTLTTPLTTEELDLFNKINSINLQARDLEIYFPLFIVAGIVGEEILTTMLTIAEKLVNDKNEEEFAENPDIALCDFIYRRKESMLDYVKINTLLDDFKVDYGMLEAEWLTTRWLGKSLQRLGLVTAKKRLAGGIQVLLNPAKAKSRLEKFKA